MLDFFGKILISFGFFFVLIGSLFLALSKFPIFGKLPGDFYFEKGNFKFYFPLTSSLLVSAIISFVIYFISKLFK